MNTIARMLRLALGWPSPSLMATIRRRDPLPKSWLARKERALALRHLGDRPSLAEQAEAEGHSLVAYLEAVIRTAGGDAQ